MTLRIERSVRQGIMVFALSGRMKAEEVAELKALFDGNKVGLPLAPFDYSSTWHSSRGPLSKNASAGTMAICEFNQARHLEMRNPTSFAVVLAE